MFEGIDHVAVLVDDYAAALKLFGTLGFPISREAFHEPSNRRTAMFDCGNTSVEIIEDLDPVAKATNLRGQLARIDHIAFEVGDMHAVLPELIRGGIAPNEAGIDASPERLSFFSEPTGLEGLLFQFVSYPRSDV
jgi:catechol 2,3-dioxygenase-like lactoylglutathione lyase family enzyme